MRDHLLDLQCWLDRTARRPEIWGAVAFFVLFGLGAACAGSPEFSTPDPHAAYPTAQVVDPPPSSPVSRTARVELGGDDRQVTP